MLSLGGALSPAPCPFTPSKKTVPRLCPGLLLPPLLLRPSSLSEARAGVGEQGSWQRGASSIFNFYGNHVLEIPKGLKIVLCFQNPVMSPKRLCCK